MDWEAIFNERIFWFTYVETIKSHYPMSIRHWNNWFLDEYHTILLPLDKEASFVEIQKRRKYQK